jgi:hypothetical protein
MASEDGEVWNLDSKGYRSRVEPSNLTITFHANGHGMEVKVTSKPDQTRLLPAKLVVKDADGKDLTSTVTILPKTNKDPGFREKYGNFLPYGRPILLPKVQKVTEHVVTLTPEQIIAIMDRLIEMDSRLKHACFEKWGLDLPDTSDEDDLPEDGRGSMDETDHD